MHALHCVSLGEGGRGQKGGVRLYADQVGKDEKTIRQCRDAARVAEYCGVNPALSAKTQHLAAIHKLPEEAWPVAVEAMIAARLRPYYEKQAKERQGTRTDLGNIPANLPESSGETRDEAGKAAGI